MRISLNYLKRVVMADWKGHARWIGREVRIWSAEHRAYWRPNAHGYTADPAKAGTWQFGDAYYRTAHCGPEKRIAFERV